MNTPSYWLPWLARLWKPRLRLPPHFSSTRANRRHLNMIQTIKDNRHRVAGAGKASDILTIDTDQPNIQRYKNFTFVASRIDGNILVYAADKLVK